jgi:hypothetical protein
MTIAELAPRPADPKKPFGVAAWAMVLTVVAVALFTLTGGTPSRQTRWGESVLDQTRQLDLCARPNALSLRSGMATCQFDDGTVQLATSNNVSAQRVLVRQLVSSEPKDCLLVGTGFVIDAPSVFLAIEAATGDLPDFLDRYGAYLSGEC